MLKVRDFLADAVVALSAGSPGDSWGNSLRGKSIDNKIFKGYSPSEAEALAVRLCEEVLGAKSYQWVLEPSMEVPASAEGRLASSLQRLCSGEPLQYVLGYADFCGFRFSVGPEVLIPRPETEELCRLVVQEAEGLVGDCVPRGSSRPENRCSLKIMDLCTGSGCIAWSLALLLPSAEVIGVDVSEEALSVARSQPLAEEAARRGATVPKFYKCDILSPSAFFPLVSAADLPSSAEFPAAASPASVADLTPCSAVPCTDFNVIVSNPPYIRESERPTLPSNVKNHEPALALFVPDSDPLLFYRAIADIAMKRLRTDGFGLVEINEALGEPTAAIFSSTGFSSVNILRDFRAKFRFIVFRK